MNLFVALFPVRNTRVELRLVGGPSWFTYDATMISTVTYSRRGSVSGMATGCCMQRPQHYQFRLHQRAAQCSSSVASRAASLA